MYDLEAKVQENVEEVGYAAVAKFITSDKEHSTSIYRQFEELSARNILYLQSELRILELKQQELDREDAGGDLDHYKMAMDLEVLAKRAQDPNDHKAQERMKLSENIREKLKEYHETLLCNAAILRLRRPTRQVYEAFHSEFNNHQRSHDSRFPRLVGASSNLYSPSYRDDLVTLCPPSLEEDRLTRWLRHRFPKLFMRRKQSGSLSSISHVASLSEKRLQVFVATINVGLAAAMLFGAIYNLYYVKSDQTKLGLIAGYTIAFAICVSLLTGARRSEVFAACAAYAAVLVVFVSGGLGGNNNLRG